MNEFQILYTLVAVLFNPGAPVGERMVTQSLSHHATELLCEQEKARWSKITNALFPERPLAYTLRCDPPNYQ